MPVDEVARGDEAVEFRFEPVHGEGVPRADRIQRHRPGVGQETFEDTAAGTPPLSSPHRGRLFSPAGGE